MSGTAGPRVWPAADGQPSGPPHRGGALKDGRRSQWACSRRPGPPPPPANELTEGGASSGSAAPPPPSPPPAPHQRQSRDWTQRSCASRRSGEGRERGGSFCGAAARTGDPVNILRLGRCRVGASVASRGCAPVTGAFACGPRGWESAGEAGSVGGGGRQRRGSRGGGAGCRPPGDVAGRFPFSPRPGVLGERGRGARPGVRSRGCAVPLPPEPRSPGFSDEGCCLCPTGSPPPLFFFSTLRGFHSLRLIWASLMADLEPVVDCWGPRATSRGSCGPRGDALRPLPRTWFLE
ncbi:hypothetical protein H8959_013903 [Pygathrix nigripes]